MPNYNDNSGYQRYMKKKEEEKKICKMYDIININRRNIRVFKISCIECLKATLYNALLKV